MIHKRNLAWVGVVASAALVLTGCGTESGTEPGASTGQEIELSAALSDLATRAAEEGSVNLFISTDAVTPAVGRSLSEGLERDFGVKITINLINGEPDPTYVGKLMEQLAASQAPDIDLIATVPGILQWLDDADAIKSVDWKALGANDDDVSEELNAVAVAEIARAVFYNTDLVDAADAPKSFDELLEPKWNGKIVTAALPDVFSPLAAGMGKEGMVDFTESLLKDQKVAIAPNPTGVRAQVISGEYEIGYGIRIGKNERESNAPIAYAPISAPVIPRAAVVLDKAANPAAAELLGYWLSTDAGRTLAYELLDWTNHTTSGTDLSELDSLSGGVWSKPLDWWRVNTGELNDAVKPLLAP
ncbi:ABC transporter substrate-binding protein [Homoserinimonas sp. A447]